jgi:hypothetical protein
VTVVLVRHDPGCKWGRATDVDIDSEGKVLSAVIGPGHSDAAKRFSDAFNLHRAAGTSSGWIAVSYADGRGGEVVYDTRDDAVQDRWPYEDRCFYATLASAPSMSVCAAESVLRWRRIMSEAERPDRDVPGGGLEVIEFLTAEDRAVAERAAITGRGLLAMARRITGNRKA